MSKIFGIIDFEESAWSASDFETLWRSLTNPLLQAPQTFIDRGAGVGILLPRSSLNACEEVKLYVDKNAGLTVVADARLDEREALAARLSISHKLSDEALIANAYLRWGETCPEHLLGDFAFAIWDARERALFAARDHFGVKPFYYAQSGSAIAFATEPGALLTLPWIDAGLNDRMIADFLVELADEGNETFHRNVKRLCPGESLRVRKEGHAIGKYYTLSPSSRFEGMNDEEYEEAFRAIFFEAVRRRLRSSGPVACMLSGGLDSSSIVCAAAAINSVEATGSIDTYSNTYPHSSACDESHYIDAVVRKTNAKAVKIPASSTGDLDSFIKAAEVLQEPCSGIGAFTNGSVYPVAISSGIRVVLDGHGGDETISHGYERLQELADEHRLFQFTQEYFSLASAFPGAASFSQYFQVASRMGFPGRVRRRLVRFRSRARISPHSSEAHPAFAPHICLDIIERTGVQERLAAQDNARRTAKNEKRFHGFTIASTGQSRGFELLGRQSLGAAEPRYPFWDKDLIEFCVALPSRLKLSKGWPRAIMRNALKSVLPDVIRLRRTKTDFTPHAINYLRSIGKDAWRDFLSDAQELYSGFLIPESLVNLVEALYARTIEISQLRALSSSLALIAWLRSLRH